MFTKYQFRVASNIKFFNDVVAVFNEEVIARAQRRMIRTVEMVQQYATFQKRGFKSFKFEQQMKKLLVIFKGIGITFIGILNVLRFYFVIELLSDSEGFDSEREVFVFTFEFGVSQIGDDVMDEWGFWSGIGFIVGVQNVSANFDLGNATVSDIVRFGFF